MAEDASSGPAEEFVEEIVELELELDMPMPEELDGALEDELTVGPVIMVEVELEVPDAELLGPRVELEEEVPASSPASLP